MPAWCASGCSRLTEPQAQPAFPGRCRTAGRCAPVPRGSYAFAVVRRFDQQRALLLVRAQPEPPLPGLHRLQGVHAQVHQGDGERSVRPWAAVAPSVLHLQFTRMRSSLLRSRTCSNTSSSTGGGVMAPARWTAVCSPGSTASRGRRCVWRCASGWRYRARCLPRHRRGSPPATAPAPGGCS